MLGGGALLVALLALFFAVGCDTSAGDGGDNGSTGNIRYASAAEELLAWAEEANSGNYSLSCTLEDNIGMDGLNYA